MVVPSFLSMEIPKSSCILRLDIPLIFIDGYLSFWTLQWCSAQAAARIQPVLVLTLPLLL
jgi:hypothetical protein